MPQPSPTVDELIATLRHSSLPTLVTEGANDTRYLRQVEQRVAIATISFSILHAGGKNAVLELFARRTELNRQNVIFLVDQDVWVHSAVPADLHHPDLLTTWGYSLENDIFFDAAPEKLLDDNERITYDAEVRAMAQWQSHCVRLILDGVPQTGAGLAAHPHKVLRAGPEIDPDFAATCGYIGPDSEIFEAIIADYVRLLRGKSLLQVLLRQLSSSKRTTKWAEGHIMEAGAAANGPRMANLTSQIVSFLKVNT